MATSAVTKIQIEIFQDSTFITLPRTERGNQQNKKPNRHIFTLEFMLHFTPTSSSWLNLVERWFRELTEKRVRRGSFGSVPELIHAIEEYLTTSNADPKPLLWKASAKAILDKLARCKAVYETLE